jgi:asparagine synthase (glutamine-hydrolysing)
MCGYLGKVSLNSFDFNSLSIANNETICRGPDEMVTLNSLSSQYTEKFYYSFIFNRLAIIDLDSGSQPMYSNKFKTLLMFNGEIFNHRELRRELESEGLEFKTSHSDSEVVLLGLSKYGTDFISKLNGQFSIAFTDFSKNKIILIRDRLGQKPLFYTIGKDLIFGSNLISVAKASNYKNLNNESLINYLKLGVVVSPNTIFENIYKINPAEIIEINLDNFSTKRFIYWKPDEKLSNDKFETDSFFEVLTDAIKIRLESDVPVANFLSGGIDSTTLVKIMHTQGFKANTFSAIFPNQNFDESSWSRNAANHYGTNHTEEAFNFDFSYEEILKSIDIFDEPYADPSTVPSFYLSKLISKHYKVAISGDGGDELLGGYPRISQALSKKNLISDFLSNLYYIYPAYFGTGYGFLKYSNNIEKNYSSYYEDIKLLKLFNLISRESYYDGVAKDYKSLLAIDYKFYLSEMMLLKIDRTSMANSLEIRSPFVDHRLVEYIFKHSTPYFDKNNPKKILKEYLFNDLGKDFVKRDKMGFIFDIESFINNNYLKVKDEILGSTLKKFQVETILERLYKNNSRMNSNRIWKILFISRYLNNLGL